MDSRQIEDTLAEQRKEVDRILRSPFRPRYAAKRIVPEPLLWIQGVRGSGKTFTCLHALRDKGISFAYVDFSDRRLQSLLDSADHDKLIESLCMVYDSFECVVADECLSHPGGRQCLEALRAHGLKVVAITSGISLSPADTPALCFYPLSFSEYCLWHDIPTGTDTPEARALVRRAFDDYTVRGGFPALQDKKRFKAPVARLVDNIFSHDIRGDIRRNKLPQVEQMGRSLLEDTVTWINYSTLASGFGMRSEVTVKKYVEAVKATGIMYALRRFAMFSKQRNVYEKLYAADPVLIGEDSRQKKLETVVYMQLRRFCERHGYFIHYYSNRNEDCNFALCVNRHMRTLIQVMADYSDTEAVREKVSGLIAMAKLTRCDRLFILTDNQHDTIEEKGLNISVSTVYDFLTDPSHKIVTP